MGQARHLMEAGWYWGGRLGMWRGHVGHVARAGAAVDGGRLGL
jgi:hypothetical protein